MPEALAPQRPGAERSAVLADWRSALRMNLYASFCEMSLLGAPHVG